ncbi:hypothetical protein CANMA_004449 [Candida margitis]|uniref:uncharacterized protein n=1 Tax=Candida margitis TaxID=1775924 RepID=UPI0022267A16|nr:uncharacterized protein CANMA_004449 [Candida margitis]KAI5957036.1 hypothetical protein CANMA_004449 [Candida margitis]
MNTTPHPDFTPFQNVVHVEGKEPEVIELEGRTEPLHVKIPGGAKFHTTVKFKVKNRKMENLRYKQVVKKGGIPFKTKMVELGTREPSETEVYEVETEEEVSPGGWVTRGVYQAFSTYYEGDEELLTNQWTLEITK